MMYFHEQYLWSFKTVMGIVLFRRTQYNEKCSTEWIKENMKTLKLDKRCQRKPVYQYPCRNYPAVFFWEIRCQTPLMLQFFFPELHRDLQKKKLMSFQHISTPLILWANFEPMLVSFITPHALISICVSQGIELNNQPRQCNFISFVSQRFNTELKLRTMAWI